MTTVADNPLLLAEWDYNKNATSSPSSTLLTSKTFVWWKCSKPGVCEHHVWKETPLKRGKGKGSCHSCRPGGSRKICIHNSIVTTHPDIAKEWDYDRNGSLRPEHVSHGCRKMVWWKCSKPGVCEHHVFDIEVANRTFGKQNCPFCSKQRVCPHTCLATTHPELCKEWDYERNTILPTEVSFGSNKVVWWVCHSQSPNRCECEHSWSTGVGNRARDVKLTGCPVCIGKQTCPCKSITQANPELAIEWCTELNGKLSLETLGVGSGIDAWWQCQACDNRWRTRIRKRGVYGHGCPRCMTSVGIKAIMKALTSHSLVYHIEVTYAECRNKSLLRFDILVVLASGEEVLIEFDGEQHFQPVRFGGQQDIDEVFAQLQYRDQLKNEFIIASGRTLLRIPYTCIESIPRIIDDLVANKEKYLVGITFKDVELYVDQITHLKSQGHISHAN